MRPGQFVAIPHGVSRPEFAKTSVVADFGKIVHISQKHTVLPGGVIAIVGV